MQSRRERILTEGMRLFGEQGYAATSIAQIEEAAGLSPGSGSLYKHFRSKQELLAAGLDRLLGSGPPAPRSAAEPERLDALLAAAVRSGFDRMKHDRDLNRVAFRGLTAFPELLRRFGTEEVQRIEQETAHLLAGAASRAADDQAAGDHAGNRPGGHADDQDWQAVATVLQAATAHYWLLEDLFGGEHPTGVSRERFIAAVVTLATAAVSPRGG
ncbi:TetR/AcrR family transcriptional regulator [Microlunatus soli]|uniref:DNA-binding transcriptional regulator, AcrR family n=1 Tax=Microlunatus soli TaxID=630515 RepID=A0A1H1M7J3_9ACTN|nr:TetR/AcrR family transcriptional regulator [Microlunatus soli]SDR82630.1 DNA-binding transcriptional regulator, AcrR family [Microlunatus soli]